MKTHKVTKTFQEINARIRSGDVVVVTAEEIIDIIRAAGPVEAARRVDVVTTKTFAPMCSSGAFILQGKQGPTVPLSSIVKDREIAAALKEWIRQGRMLLGEPQFTLPSA